MMHSLCLRVGGSESDSSSGNVPMCLHPYLIYVTLVIRSTTDVRIHRTSLRGAEDADSRLLAVLVTIAECHAGVY